VHELVTLLLVDVGQVELIKTDERVFEKSFV
jgi:hypothetical protein